MKKYVLLGCVLCPQFFFAQSFTEVPITSFDAVSRGAVAFADVDGDNDQDVIITGSGGSDLVTKLYLNDGIGNFTEAMDTPFEAVDLSSLAFVDVDGDTDQDVLITGSTDSAFLSALYLNDGSGSFTEAMNTAFEGVGSGSVAFADVDGDDDPDVIITGSNDAGRIAKLYTNDGNGNFSEVAATPFEGIAASAIAFADVDGDNDQDVLMTGSNGSSRIARLYTNDGSGNFAEGVNTTFDGVEGGSLAFADVDNDNDQDVLITGFNSSAFATAKLYANDGSGNFSEITGTAFTGVGSSALAFADVDEDNDQDVLITGFTGFFPISTLFTNDGSGNFSAVQAPGIDSVNFSALAFADVDGDNDQDVLLTGRNLGFVRIAKLYLNDGTVSTIGDLYAGFHLKLTPYPNPTKADILRLQFDSPDHGLVDLKVFDVAGRLVRQQQEFVPSGRANLRLNIASLAIGNYFIQVQQGAQRGMARFSIQSP
ncbi:MAG: FG-GAP-like repeat-containing protein [Bacteroidota bacterium]